MPLSDHILGFRVYQQQESIGNLCINLRNTGAWVVQCRSDENYGQGLIELPMKGYQFCKS